MLKEACGIFQRSELQLKSFAQLLTTAWRQCPRMLSTTYMPTCTSFKFQRENKSCSNSTHVFPLSSSLSNFKSVS